MTLRSSNVLIADEFLPLTGKVQEMHAHLDQGMVSFHPEAKPEQEHYRAPDTRTCGQNKARGSE